MKPLRLVANAGRTLSTMFPGFFADAKHNHYRDFGYPSELDFSQFYAMYRRNGLAAAGINKTAMKTWQDSPQIWETDDSGETKLEGDIRQWLQDLRFWQNIAEVDRRSMVGGYSGLVIRYADNKLFQEPVDTVPGGMAGVVEVIPAWAGQLTVAQWDTDERSETYGQPLMFNFNEAAIGDSQGKNRAFTLHPDRVHIWSRDGTTYDRSALEPGYNSLLDLEKISGAGGEGFWKNAKSAPVLEIDADAQIEQMARSMGVSPEEVADKMDEQVGDWNKGFDQLLMLQGMTAKTLSVTLPSPEHFFNVSLQVFAASLPMPQKILVGNQTGERASTEDAAEWAQINMARRNMTCLPNIMGLVDKFEAANVLPERDWHYEWSDLTEAGITEKVERADKMASINQKQSAYGELVYLPDEIREVTGHDVVPGGIPTNQGEYEEDDEI